MLAGYKPGHLLLAFVCLAGAAAHLARAANITTGDFEIGFEPSYFSGKFGTSHPIHIYYLPVDLQYKDGPASIRITLPYISVAGRGLVSGGTIIATGGPSARRGGLGDIWITGRYRFYTLNGIIPNIIPYLKLKVPTASRSMGLGTGHPDEEIGGSFQWRIGRRVFPFAQFGYRIVGKSMTLRLRNVPIYKLGGTLALAPSRYLTLVTVGHPSIQNGFGPIEELLLVYDTPLTRRTGLQLYLDKGLTKSSSAFGAGLGLTVRF